IKKVSACVSLPRLLSLSWDIESSDTRDPSFFPIGHEPTSYVYAIQMDFYWIFEQTPFQHYCITTLPINRQLFFSKYSDCPSSNFHFIICDSEISLLLNFAKIFHNFKPDFEFGYNTG
ncbi:646_t:CDS:1, partial [Dentiscutata erythropus]